MDSTLDRDQLYDETLGDLLELLDDKQYFRARDLLLKFNPADIADLLEDISDDAGLRMTVVLFRLLPKDVSVDVFAELSPEDQMDIVSEVTEKETSFIVNELDFDDKIDILEEMPPNLVTRILEKTPASERKQINTFLNYPDNTAGSLMTPEYVSVKKDWTVKESLAHIRHYGTDAETIYTCYVRDGSWRLLGVVSLSTIVLSDEDTKIMDIMHTDVVSENVDADQEEVSDDFKKYGYIAMPVVDKDDRLVGIITVDDILDVMEDEATEDIERMNGVIDFQDAKKGYLDLSVWQHTKNRLPWLLILSVIYIFTSVIIDHSEHMLSSAIQLVTYIPLLMGMGGNGGSQAASLVIRGLATDEIETEDWSRVLWKEIRVGIILGIILSAVNFARVVFLDRQSIMMAAAVCAAMFFITIIAKVIGSMVPLIVKKLRLDPALIANPAITSASDIAALLVYFALAGAVMQL
ncbi:MAG: magnesium transporter [Eubacterium sp.]|jgi:magnesium transporter|nr:magnesium transporter [Eubacterium sp.]MCH4046475.1 magnesium transporter [Eubacterium sp.]MCH4079570.1 magnesium transporter [Eubacterium sp.]MCH4111150.1 magnesium transporter [Eubacterium sp.]MCI1307346.1 magnesium transporter [Eubacterium sp.]